MRRQATFSLSLHKYQLTNVAGSNDRSVRKVADCKSKAAV